MNTIGYSQSSSFYIGALFTCLLLFGTYLVSYFIGISSDNSLISESVAAIDTDINRYSGVEELAGFEQVQQLLRSRIDGSDHGFFYALRDANKDWVMGNIQHWPDDITVNPDGLIKFDIAHSALNYQSPFTFSTHFDVMAKIHNFSSGHQLIVGRDVDALEIFRWVGQTFGWIMIAIIVLISGASIAMSFYVVNRINKIAETADNIIETGNLSERIPITNKWDDLSKLSVVLNRLFSELELMVQSVRSVSDNIAHDLRTPLTRLRGDLADVENTKIKRRLIDETDNILSIFNSLLRIADIETEKRKEGFEMVDVNEVAQDVAELFAPIAEEKDIAFSYDFEPIQTVADKDLLFQAFANVLDNALKFTPEGGNIAFSLTLSEDQNHWQCAISDSGVGLSDADKERVTQRFYRVDESRHKPGNGLGLPLVLAIVNLHGGQLKFDSDDTLDKYPGLKCIIVCPV